MSAEVFVLVPSYNHAPFVERCLQSIIKQTLAPKKLLVIDDGSRDDSPRIIERALRDCPFECELIARENRGLCATLNEGFNLSGGKYFAYLGSDDFWLPRFLQERAALLDRRENAVLGYGHAYLVNEREEIIGSTVENREHRETYPDGDARRMLASGFAPVSSTVFYRRAALENIPWNEKARLEDYEMYLRLAPLGDFAFDAQTLAAWRKHEYNTSRDRLLMLREVLAAQERNRELLGIDADELKRMRAETEFRYARDLLQHGAKRDALQLAIEGWRGAGALRLAKFSARMLLPMSVVNFYRRLKTDSQRKLGEDE